MYQKWSFKQVFFKVVSFLTINFFPIQITKRMTIPLYLKTLFTFQNDTVLTDGL